MSHRPDHAVLIGGERDPGSREPARIGFANDRRFLKFSGFGASRLAYPLNFPTLDFAGDRAGRTGQSVS